MVRCANYIIFDQHHLARTSIFLRSFIAYIVPMVIA
jgi:hypothetical protein